MNDRAGWRQTLLTGPGIGVALLPKLACPACAPAYAAIASSLGLGFLTSSAYLLPVIVAGLAVALGGLAFRANRRHGYRPFVLGLAGTAAVMVGKFTLDVPIAVYSGVALLLIASVWNTWPLRRDPAAPCAACQVH